MAPSETVGPALAGILEGLKLARRELDGVEADPERWRWVAVGLVTALSGAAIAALSGYATAGEQDIRDPNDRSRMAPLRLLLRRAKSDRYLVPPEQLPASASAVDAALRLADYRNQVLHGGRAACPATVVSDTGRAVDMISHFILRAPAFDPAPHQLHIALIEDEISALARRLEGLG